MSVGADRQNRPVTPEPGLGSPHNGHTSSPERAVSPKKDRENASESGSIVDSLRKRSSSTFWTKRKSSLGNELKQQSAGKEDEPEYQGHARISSTASGPNSPDESLPLRKKKSGTFWPRKLSLSLQRETENGQKLDSNDKATPKASVDESQLDRKMSEAASFISIPKSPTPPPKLPELSLNGHGLGGGSLLDESEDLFGNIGRD